MIHEIGEILILIKDCQKTISLNTVSLPILIFLQKSEEDYVRLPNSLFVFQFLIFFIILSLCAVLQVTSSAITLHSSYVLHLFLCNPPTASKSCMWFFFKNNLLSFDGIFVLCSYFSFFFCISFNFNLTFCIYLHNPII